MLLCFGMRVFIHQHLLSATDEVSKERGYSSEDTEVISTPLDLTIYIKRDGESNNINLYMNIHGKIIYSSQKVGKTKMSNNE